MIIYMYGYLMKKYHIIQISIIGQDQFITNRRKNMEEYINQILEGLKERVPDGDF